MHEAREKIAALFGAAAGLDHQVIEGSPGREFEGRLSFHLDISKVAV